MNQQWLGALLGITVTLAIFCATCIFHLGRLSSRVEALEKWRETIRVDMHEISDVLFKVGEELKRLSTVIEERTERRSDSRRNNGG